MNIWLLERRFWLQTCLFLREVLFNGEIAFLVSSRDVEGWKDALLQLITQPGLREQLGNRAKQDFLAEYAWERRAEKVLNGLYCGHFGAL